MSRKWGIIGGGMLGMTLALRLAQRGERVTMIEAADRLGGLADAWHVGSVQWDRHYHVTLMSDSYLRALLNELGLDRTIRWTETKTGFYTDGKLHSLSNTLEFLRCPPLSLWNRLRLGGTIYYASKIRNARRLERVRVADWLLRWSGKRTFDKIWRPLLQAKLGDSYRDTSAAFIWATIGRMYAARRTGLKKEMFGYVPGGYRQIVHELAAALGKAGVEIRLGAPVDSVTSVDKGVQVAFGQSGVSQQQTDAKPADFLGARAAPDDEGEESTIGPRIVSFDRVILTTPSPRVARLCPQLGQSEKDRLASLQYLGVLCMSVLLQNPLSEYYVTNITDSGFPFTGVIEMTALVDRSAFDGKSLVYLPKYLPSDSPDFERSDEEVEREFISGLERMIPTFDQSQVIATRISRARHVMAVPTLNYSIDIPPMRTSIDGIYIVNASQIVNSTLNVNETVRQAETAVDMLE